MKIGEVGLVTTDVRRLANFYKTLFCIDNGSDDDVHQFIISEETMLTVAYDEAAEKNRGSSIALAFTVTDVDKEYLRLQELGVTIVEPPQTRP